MLKRIGKKKGTLLHATQMNSIRTQLLQQVQAEETWGFVTKEHRHLAGLPKAHIFDAAVIATRGANACFPNKPRSQEKMRSRWGLPADQRRSQPTTHTYRQNSRLPEV